MKRVGDLYNWYIIRTSLQTLLSVTMGEGASSIVQSSLRRLYKDSNSVHRLLTQLLPSL